ncbi:MAG: hypothetical protein ACJ70S_07850 [Nitrososphaera sp.]
MPKVDPAPLLYGPLQYYQLHFIMEMKNKDNDRFLATCKPQTSDCLQNKHIIGVKWIGEDNLVEVLETDTALHNMLKEIVMTIGDIMIDSQDDPIRTPSR